LPGFRVGLRSLIDERAIAIAIYTGRAQVDDPGGIVRQQAQEPGEPVVAGLVRRRWYRVDNRVIGGKGSQQFRIVVEIQTLVPG
jgi:hypothetical protein